MTIYLELGASKGDTIHKISTWKNSKHIKFWVGWMGKELKDKAGIQEECNNYICTSYISGKWIY